MLINAIDTVVFGLGIGVGCSIAVFLVTEITVWKQLRNSYLEKSCILSRKRKGSGCD